MKRIISILLILVLSVMLCSCDEKIVVSYEETSSVLYAQNLYESGNYSHFIDFCETMAGNNDDKQDRDNFFNYILIFFSDIESNSIEEEYENALNIISACLEFPLTEQHIINGLKATYSRIDMKLAEKSKQVLIGKWKRVDNTHLANSIIEVFEDENGELKAKIVAIPDGDTTNFRIGDIKWKNIQFANHKCIYLFDKSNYEINAETYYKNNDKTVSSYVGATASLNADDGIITLKYDSDMSQDSVNVQVWQKIQQP